MRWQLVETVRTCEEKPLDRTQQKVLHVCVKLGARTIEASDATPLNQQPPPVTPPTQWTAQGSLAEFAEAGVSDLAGGPGRGAGEGVGRSC